MNIEAFDDPDQARTGYPEFALESLFRDIRGIPESEYRFTHIYRARFRIRFRFHLANSQGANSSMVDKYPAYLAKNPA